MSLGDVEDNAQQLQASGGLSAIEEVSCVIRRFHYEELVSMALLHRHFSLLPEERMVQDESKEEELIISKPEIVDESHCTPTLLQVVCNTKFKASFSWVPLEFKRKTHGEPSSTSTIVLQDVEFLRELGAVLVAHQLEKVLGISLGQSEQYWIEENYLEQRTSILRQGNFSDSDEVIIETAWSCDLSKQRGCVRSQGCKKIGTGHAYIWKHANS